MRTTKTVNVVMLPTEKATKHNPVLCKNGILTTMNTDKDVLIFKYLPILWYKYPIPNEIREFWYNDRPDILKYMQDAYKNVDIQFLPDQIINQSDLLKTSLKQISLNSIPVQEGTSNLMISLNFSTVQELGYAVTHQFESYSSFVSHLIL